MQDTIHASWVEIIWSIGHLIGIIANTILIRRTNKKRANARKLGKNEGRRLAGLRYLRWEGCRLVFHLVGVFVGAWSMLLEVSTPLFTLATQDMLIFMSILILLTAIWDLRDEWKWDKLVGKRAKDV